MNIALPAFVAFLILLPGFIFRARFKLAERTSLDFSPFGRVAADAILWAICAHILWLAVSFFSQRFEPAVLLKLLSSAPSSQTEAVSAVGRDFAWIAGYFQGGRCYFVGTASIVMSTFLTEAGIGTDRLLLRST